MRKVMRLIIVLGQLGLLLGLMPACGDFEVKDGFSTEELSSLNAKIEISLVSALDGQPRLKITESFVMPRNSIYVRLPSTFLRKEKLYDRIENLRVSGDGRLLPYQNEPSVKKLLHEQGKQVVISYLYRPDDPINYKPEKESTAAPIIRDNYFQFVGMMALVHPVALESAGSFDLTIEWKLPEDFFVFNSFGGRQTKQTVRTTYDKMRDALFVAGNDLRVADIQVRGRPVTIAFQGHWPKIADEDFVDVVSRLLHEQRKTWNDDNFPYFFVHFLAKPSACKGATFMGTAHTNSFRAVFPDACQFEPEMKHLISHELMHMWIGKKIKMGQKRGHIDGKWFTEGFTDYYGRLLAYKAGVLSGEQYRDTFLVQLKKYYTSPKRYTPLYTLVDRMYRGKSSDRELEGLPYQQGEFIAWRLDNKIMKASAKTNNLDDVVRELLKQADDAGGTKNFSAQEIAIAFDQYVPGALRQELSKVEDGQLLCDGAFSKLSFYPKECRSIYLP